MCMERTLGAWGGSRSSRESSHPRGGDLRAVRLAAATGGSQAHAQRSYTGHLTLSPVGGEQEHWMDKPQPLASCADRVGR